MVNIIIGIVGVLLIAGAISLVANEHVGAGIPTIILGIAIVIFSTSFVIIPTGYTGVRTTFGLIDEAAVQNGFNWKLPLVQSITKVNNKIQDQTFEGEIWGETSERTAICYDGVTVTYQIVPDKSAWIYANVSNYTENLISTEIVSSAIKSSSKTLNDTDATNRSIIESITAEQLQLSIDEKYGENVVTINKVVISNADFEDSYNESIAAKQQAQIEAEEQAIENQKVIDKAEAEAEAARITAQAEADVALIEANAEAEAALVKAEAEAEANEKLSDSLNENILQYYYIGAWDGKLPTYMSGDADSVLIGIE